MKDLNDEGEKMGNGTRAAECGSESETNPTNLPLRDAPCLQCPRLGDGIFQRDDGACQHTSGSGWQRMGGRRRDQYVFEPDGKCSVV